METESEPNEEIKTLKAKQQELETRIETLHNNHLQIISFIQNLVPDIVGSLDLSQRVVSTFNGRQFSPLPTPLPDPGPNFSARKRRPNEAVDSLLEKTQKLGRRLEKRVGFGVGERDLVRGVVVRCLVEMEMESGKEIDSLGVFGLLEGDQRLSVGEKAALRDLDGVLGVETALRSLEVRGAVQLEKIEVGGNSRVLVKRVDRSKLLKELPVGKRVKEESALHNGNVVQQSSTAGGNLVKQSSTVGGNVQQSSTLSDDVPQSSTLGQWIGPREMPLPGGPPFFPGGGMVGPRGVGPRGMIGFNPINRPPLGNQQMIGSASSMKPKTEEDELKGIEELLLKPTFNELNKKKTGEEFMSLIHRPTARETAVAEKFKSKGGSQVKEYCTALTKEDCRLKSQSPVACEKVHFRRIIALHTDVNLGDCSFLDTCRHMKTCKYVHYELDSTLDISPTTGAPPRPLKLRPEYCSEVELGEPQWINCDIRNFRMDILGQYGVIMADPPWDIHMELPYGTMGDDEMRNLNIQALQTDGLIFLWVTGRAMELGRECLELWGYKRVEEIIWVKTNQLQRIIRTGRTGHWLNHSKEHCLVGIKGDPIVNRNIDTDVIVAEVRETSRKPDEMYPMLERISPRTRKVELFARMHNAHAGWMSLGNQLNGVRLVDEGLRARFKAAYPEIEVQPPSPPRPSSVEADPNMAQTRSPSGTESKPTSTQLANVQTPDAAQDKSASANPGLDTPS